MQVRGKVGKSQNTMFFLLCGSGSRKVGSLKRRVRSQVCRWEMKTYMLLRRKARFQVKNAQNWRLRGTFRSWDVEQVHAVGAQSTRPSQNVQNTTFSYHFWKLRCRKSACRCSAKHMSKSKVSKTDGLRPLLEGGMSKKCTPLWREAHFQVGMVKHHMFGPLLGVQMSKKCTRSRCGSRKRKKTVGFHPILRCQLTNWTGLTNLTNLTNLANLTNLTTLTDLTDQTKVINSTNLS